MNIVVIGGGWLGLPLSVLLNEKKYQTTITYRTNKPIVQTGINLEQYDGNFVSETLQGKLSKADTVFFVFPPPKNSNQTHFGQCLELATYTSPACTFVFVSTTGVYPNESKSFTEEMVLPDQHAENKHLITEFELRDKLKERLTIVRMAGLVGGNRFPAKNMSASGKTYNGSELVNLIHQVDAVRVLEFVLEQELWGKTFNACAPEHPEKGEYYTWMAEQMEIYPPVFEKGPTGKIIQSDLLLSLGFTLERPNPYEFLQ